MTCSTHEEAAPPERASGKPSGAMAERNPHWRTACTVFLAALIIVGGATIGRFALGLIPATDEVLPTLPPARFAHVQASRLPGPPRDEDLAFVLTAENSQAMAGRDCPGQERWCDAAGNFYSKAFFESFSYENPTEKGPAASVRIEKKAPTFRGRLEVRGLKPNFAYQMKLRGDFRFRENFEAIGRLGRWRLPGKETNYSDDDYEEFPDKNQVEAYVLFDFFVTDKQGCAVRQFALDSSLHVLWNVFRQARGAPSKDVLAVIVDASDPTVYLAPKRNASIELIWGEHESSRYRRSDRAIRLPPGPYHAEFVLVEETFHSSDNDGGWWPTVFRLPVEFEIAAATGAEK